MFEMDNIEMILRANRSNELRQKWVGNLMATDLSFSLWALLEDRDNHKEPPLTHNKEPDIRRN